MDRSTIAGGGGFPDLGLDGAVIVVTGAGSGIGLATAKLDQANLDLARGEALFTKEVIPREQLDRL